MTREEAIRWLEDIHRRFNPTRENLENEGGDVHLQALDMAIEALKAKTDGDLISRQDAIKNAHFPMIDDAGYEVVRVDDILALPSAEPKTDEENELKFYYVESIDDYWIGQRLDNFYYADWHNGLGFVWSKSRYLPWGEHIVNENTLWKEHTYPSEPIEIPFTEWIVGFVKKYFAEPKTGEWIQKDMYADRFCSECNYAVWDSEAEEYNFCPNCGADMTPYKGGDEE